MMKNVKCGILWGVLAFLGLLLINGFIKQQNTIALIPGLHPFDVANYGYLFNAMIIASIISSGAVILFRIVAFICVNFLIFGMLLVNCFLPEIAINFFYTKGEINFLYHVFTPNLYALIIIATNTILCIIIFRQYARDYYNQTQ